MSASNVLKNIINPVRWAESYSALDKRDREEKSIDSYEKLMANKYLEQNPEADFSSSPGYQAIQSKYNEKLLNQGGRLFTAKKDKSGKVTGYSPKEGAKEELDQEKMISPIVMGRTGFEPASGEKRKDYVFGEIQKKRQSGLPVSDIEAKFEKKYLGIKDSKNAPTTGAEWDKTLEQAKDDIMAQRISNRVKGLGEDVDPETLEEEIDKVKAVPITFEEAKGGLESRLRFKYPNMEEEKIQKIADDYESKNKDRWVPELGIALPGYIGTLPQAHKYLTENGMDPEQAARWLQERN